MWEYTKSVFFFLGRWLKFAWPALILYLLDLSDIWRRWMEPLLPESWHGLTVPTPLVVVGGVIIMFWAAAHVFHQIRIDHDKLATQLDDKVPEDVVEHLSDLWEELVLEIWSGPAVTAASELDVWTRKWRDWDKRTGEYMKKHVSPTQATLFRIVGHLDTPPISGGFNNAHNEALRAVMWQMNRLRGFLDKHSRVTPSASRT